MISAATRAAIASSMASASQQKAAAIQAAVQHRQQQQVAVQQHVMSMQQQAAGAAAKGAAAKGAKKKGPKTGAALASGKPEVAPYYDSESLLAMGARNEDTANRNADRGADYAKQAALADRGYQEAELGRVAGNETTKNSMAARGLEQSSIRDGALDAVDVGAARKVAGLRSDLATLALQNDEQRARDDRGNSDFAAAMALRATENAAAVPRDPRGAPAAAKTGRRVSAPALHAAPRTVGPGPAKYRTATAKKTASGGHASPARAAQQVLAQRRAGNVKGAVTLRRRKGI